MISNLVRKVDEMKVAVIVLALLLSVVTVLGGLACSAIKEQVVSYTEKQVEIPSMSEQTLTIHCSSGDRIDGSFTVLENDIRFYIKDPSRNTVYNAGRVEHNTFNVYCTSTGYYTLYFDNSYSIITSKTVFLRYRRI